MTETDKKEFAMLISALAESFMGKEKPSNNLIKLYWASLVEYEIEEISMACTRLFKTWTFHFLPKPAHIIELIEGNEKDKAQMAWQHVIDEISRKGISASFDQITARAILACGGTIAIAHCPIDKISFKEKDFISNYRSAIKSVGFKQIEDKKLKALTENIG